MLCRARALQYIRRQCYSTSAHHPADLRNIALVAHIDSGKTTLTESILLKSSYLSSPGTVDTGSTTTDFLPVERERGITVQSASIPVDWKKWSFNLIDTPGHADFGMEVESASRVIDAAVVLIDAVEGVEPQTKGVWRQLDRYGVNTRIVFINKLDRPGASFGASLRSLLRHRLHSNPMAITLPIASFRPNHYAESEPGIQGLVDLVRWNVWKWDSDGTVSTIPLPRELHALEQSDIFPRDHPILPHLAPARAQLLENISMLSDEFMEHLLVMPSGPSTYLQVEDNVVTNQLRMLALQNQALPVMCGSAMQHIGTDLLMDYIGELFPSPVDLDPVGQKSNAPLQLLAWKVTWDSKKGWMTFVRVYSGTLNRQSTLLNTNCNQKERINKLLLLYAGETKEVESLPFGSVGVVLGLKHTRTGDTLVAPNAPPAFKESLRDITPPPAVISASVIPQSRSDLQPVQDALEALARTDPSVRVENQDGQLLVHGLGSLHLEIIEGRLRDEWNVNFEFGDRRVSYRQGLGSLQAPDGWNVWETEVGGKPVKVTVPIHIRSLEPEEVGDSVWDGNVILDEKGRPVSVPDSFQSTSLLKDVANGILNGLSNSSHTSLPMTRLRIQIGSLKELESKVSPIVTGATAAVLRNRIRDAGMGPLLEPYVLLKISAGEQHIRKIVKDITERHGEILDMSDDVGSAELLDGYSEENVYVPPDFLSPSGAQLANSTSPRTHVKRSIQAFVPLSQFLDYSNRLRSMSEGHGVFEMTSVGFREVSETRKSEILKEIGKA